MCGFGYCLLIRIIFFFLPFFVSADHVGFVKLSFRHFLVIQMK